MLLGLGTTRQTESLFASLCELVTKPNPSVILNQSVKEPTLFDNL